MRVKETLFIAMGRQVVLTMVHGAAAITPSKMATPTTHLLKAARKAALKAALKAKAVSTHIQSTWVATTGLVGMVVMAVLEEPLQGAAVELVAKVEQCIALRGLVLTWRNMSRTL